MRNITAAVPDEVYQSAGLYVAITHELMKGL
jgi:hypothetical protein